MSQPPWSQRGFRRGFRPRSRRGLQLPPGRGSQLPPGGVFPLPPGGVFPLPPGGVFPLPPGGVFPLPPGGVFPLPPGGVFPLPPGGGFQLPLGGGFQPSLQPGFPQGFQPRFQPGYQPRSKPGYRLRSQPRYQPRLQQEHQPLPQQELEDFNSENKFLRSDYDYTQAFYKAVSILFLSYPEIEEEFREVETQAKSEQNMPTMRQPIRQKMEQFIEEMRTLYGIQQPVDWGLVQTNNSKSSKKRLYISVTVKRLRGVDGLVNPRFFVIRDQGTKKETRYIHYDQVFLDPDREVQTRIWPEQTRITTYMKELAISRKDSDHAIILYFEADNWPQTQPLRISIAHIHPEGYEEWVDFEGVQLLINIEFKDSVEPNTTPEKGSEFHMHSIYKMLERRLEDNQSKTGPPYQYMATHQRFLVHPEMSTLGDIFWSEPSDERATVKFIDLQVSVLSYEDSEESVCLCSEWCNWNAFFYYNPMYRFLLVRHYQLYLKNKTTLPNMYLFMSILWGCRISKNVYPKPSILHLINSANEFRRKHYLNYLIDETYKNEFDTCKPNGQELNVVSYNLLNNQLDVKQLCFELDANPLSDACIESLQIYYKVLIDLHFAVAIGNRFIRNKVDWKQRVESLGRESYCDYLKQSYVKLTTPIADLNMEGIDYLFTQDFEYVSRPPKYWMTLEEEMSRDAVLNKTENPLNVSIRLNQFSNAFVSIYKYITQLDSVIHKPSNAHSYQLLFHCYREMDQHFEIYRQNHDFETIVYLGDNLFFGTLSEQQKLNFDAFYTLKLYFYLFEIQKRCIKSLEIQNTSQSYFESPKYLTSTEFDFIWNNSMVEQTLFKYHQRFLFEQMTEFSHQFNELFDNFYEEFWGPADHETSEYNDIREIVKSGFYEYQRLDFWWKNNGNNKTKFTVILRRFLTVQRSHFDQSLNVFRDHILPAILDITLDVQNPDYRYVYYNEVFDHLVYYLVKAICSMILSTTANFIKKFQDLQDQELIDKKICYSLCKPGWIPFFQTMPPVLRLLKYLETPYITFDDQFNRISNTTRETQQMVKDMYRQFYQKLASEWIQEIDYCLQELNRAGTNASTAMIHFPPLHLAVGLSFIYAFSDYFRFNFCRLRKYSLRLLNRFANVNLDDVKFAKYTECRDIILDYLCPSDWTIEADQLGERETLLSIILKQFVPIEILSQIIEDDVDINLDNADVPVQGESGYDDVLDFGTPGYGESYTYPFTYILPRHSKSSLYSKYFPFF